MYDLKLYLLEEHTYEENLYDPGLENLSYKIKSRSHKKITLHQNHKLQASENAIKKGGISEMAELRIS